MRCVLLARTSRAASLTTFACVLLCAVPTVHADGVLPPTPYRYLHPPAALRADNQPPAQGMRLLPADYMRAVLHWAVFTQDGQAGVSGRKGSLGLSAAASDVIIRLDPVDTPPGLPSSVGADGNAYRVSIEERPTRRTVPIAHPVDLTFQFPHVPLGVYSFRAGKWSLVCGRGRERVNAATVTCSSAHLGTFVVVTFPSGGGTPMPPTPISSTPFGWINRYIPLIVAALIVLGAAIAGYIVSRPDDPARTRKS